MRRLLLVLLLCALCSGCSTSTQPVIPGASVAYPNAGAPVVYAAIGASETAGAGTFDPDRDAWPTVFYDQALPTAATYYNFGIGDETTAAALRDEVPRALALRPTVVTIWLNVDDIVNGVPLTVYTANLTTIVRDMRQGGRATVLLANTPVLDDLPLVRACLGQGPLPPDPPTFPPLTPGGSRRDACQVIAENFGVLTDATINARVAAFNAAISAVASAQGAVLVNLHSQGDIALTDPRDISRQDGFHPSDAGHAAIAALFAAAYRARPAGSR